MIHAERSTSEQALRRHAELVRVFSGPIGDALGDPAVIEVLVNDDGRLYVERIRQGMQFTGQVLPSRAVEDAIVTAASEMGKVIDEAQPTLSGELPLDGSRVQAFFPDVTRAPALAIRKHRKASDTIPALQFGDFAGPPERAGEATVTLEGLTVPEILDRTVRARWNVVFAGGTSSGKTAIGGAFLERIAALCPDDRIIVIEDTRELQCDSANRLLLKSTANRTSTQLVQDALRARPDRIILGEGRDGAVHDFLMACNTGHAGGFLTIHANSALDALYRVEDCVQLRGVPVVPRAIARAIDLIVGLARGRDKSRRVVEIARVDKQLSRDRYQLTAIPVRW